MAVTGQIYFLSQDSLADGRFAVFNSDGTSQVVIADNTPTVDLITQFPEEVGVDTAAGFYFAIVNGGNDGSDARLVRGSLSGGAVTVIATYTGALPADSSDDDIVNALYLDVFNHKIYVGDQDGTGSDPANTGIRVYDYNPVSGAVTGGSFIATVTSSAKAQESGFDIFDVRDFALNTTSGNLFFSEWIYNPGAGLLVQGVWRIATNGTGLTQVVSQAAFPDSGVNGIILDVEVDNANHLIFDTHSLRPFGFALGNPDFIPAQNQIWYIAQNASGGTPTQFTLVGMPGGSHFYPENMAYDVQTGVLYVTSEEVDTGGVGAADDVIYAFSLNFTTNTATLVSTTLASPNFVNDDTNFGGLLVNDIPILTSLTATATHAGEQGAAVALLTGQPTVTDTDGDHLKSATVQITGGTFSSNENSTADDHLTAVTTGTGITASYNAATETLTLSGYDTIANYKTVLASVTYNATGDNPTNYGANTTRTVTWTVSDGAANIPAAQQNSGTTTITIDAVNDAPVNTVGATAVVVEDATNTAITGWSIADVDANPASAVMTVVLSVTHGTLNVTTPAGGSVANNASAAVTVTGTQNAINAMITASGVKYTPTANFNGSDNLHIVTSDGGLTGSGGTLSDTDDKAISITAVNDAPFVAGDGTETSLTIFEDQPSATGQTISTLFAGQYSDALDNQIPNGGASSPGAFTGVAVVANGSGAGTGQWQWLNGATWTDIGAVSLASAKLFADTAAIRFNPVADYNGAEPTLTVHLIDNSLGFGITNAQVVNISGVNATGGTTAYSTGTVVLDGTVSPVNDAPTITSLAADAASWTENGGQVALDVTGNAVVGDIDSTDFDTGSLTVFLTGATSHDGLFIASVGGVTTSGNTVSVGATQIGTFAGGGFGGGGLQFAFDADATPAAVQALVRAIRFDNDSEDPLAITRNVTWTLKDGDGTANGGTDTRVIVSTIQTIAVNDAPVLDATPSLALTTINEDAGAPVGAVGTLVSSMIDNAVPATGLDNFSDVDGIGIGIAVTGTDTANGSWFYSTNGGGTWNAMGAVSDGAARFLAADANTRLYFQPTANFSGSLPTAITFRAWDQATGTNGGLGSTVSTSFSTASDTASLTVTAINDAPTSTNLSGNAAVYSEQGGPILLDVGGDATFADLDSANFDTGTLTVTIASAATVHDGFFLQNDGNGPGQIGVAGNAVSFGGTQFATFSGGGFGNGGLTFFLDSDATPAAIQALVRVINYDNDAGDTPTAGTRNINWVLKDGDGTANGGADTLTVVSSLQIVAVNDAPVNTVPLALQSVAQGSTLTFSSGNGNAITTADPEALSGQVQLTVTHGTISLSGVTGLSFTVGDGTSDATMTFTGLLGDINTALAGLVYTPTPGYSGSDSLSILTSDLGASGTGGAKTDLDTVSIDVIANLAPTLDASKTPVLGTIIEDAGAPSGAVGTLVSSLIDNTAQAGGLDNFTDSDGPQVGIALTGTDTANGSWFYSINGGGTWSAMGAVSDGAARFLLANANTRLYFQPNADFNGTVANAITFRAWDGATGSNGGLGNTSGGGGSTAFSSATDTANITVTPVNDAPTSANLQGNGVTWTEGDPAVALDAAGDATFADIDSADFNGGTLTVTIVSATAQDGLFIAAVGTVTSTGTTVSVGGTQIATYTGGGFGGSPLVFTLDPDATPASVGALVHAISYNNNGGANPTPGNRVINWTLVDGDGTANGGTDTLSNATTVAVVAINNLPITNVDSIAVAEGGTATTLVGGETSVLANDIDPEGGPLTAGIVLGPVNGALTLNPNGTFSYVHNGSETTTDSFAYRSVDNAFGSTIATVSIAITPVNDAPAIGGLANVGYTEQATITLAPGLTLNDPDNANLTGATVAISDAIGGDALALSGALPGGITLSGASTSSSIVLTGTASVADYQAALRLVTFTNSTDDPTTQGTDNTRLVQFSATDGTATSPLGNVGVAISAVNDAPVNFVPGAQSAQINTSITFSTANGNPITTSDADAGSGVVHMVLTADHGTVTLGGTAGLSVTGNGTGTVDLSGTVSAINAALEGTVYTFTPAYSGPAQLVVNVNDNGLNPAPSQSDSDTIAITVVPNAAPVLDATKAPVLTSELEDAGAPSGAVGTLVSSLVDNASTTGQVDNVTDADGPSLGIAITAASTASGSWHFSTNNGTTWSALGAVSDASARLLSADANTRVYFQPNANFNGTLSSALTFRAWDGFTGTNGTTASTTVNGGATAFSSVTDTAALTITPVNDPATVSISFAAGIEDTTTGLSSASFTTGEGDTPIAFILTTAPAQGTVLYLGNPLAQGQEVAISSLGDFANLKFRPAADAFASPYATFGLQVRDSGGTANGGVDLSNIVTITMNVAPVADAPGVTGAATSEDVPTTSGLVVTRNAVDSTEVTHFKITGITGGTLFLNDGVTAVANSDFITFAQGNAGLKFSPTANFFGNAGFDVAGATSAAGAGLGVTSHATITVSPVADTPSITAAATNEDTQSATGLVVSRNAGDSAEVTHFKITGITNGQLFLNDGVTQVTNGSFITFADANAGLKFTPDPDFAGNGSFNVQASLSASDAGLGGAVVPATVTVAAVNDAPFISMIGEVTTNEDTAFAFNTPFLRVDVGDVDAGTNPVQVTLTSTHGVSTLSSTTGLSFSVGDGLDDTVMTFTGTIDAIDAALLSLSFSPDANFNGDAKLEGSISDQGSTGSGGVLTGTNDTIIHVTSVNDAPAGTNATVTTAEDTAYVFAAADFGFTDPADSPANTLLAVKLATLPGAGSLLLDGAAVTAGQTVSAADITAGKLTYAPPADANGAGLSSFTFQVQDNGGTANGGIDLDASANTMTLTVTAVNDGPVNTVPATASTNEDTVLAFTGASAVTIADIDAASAPVQVTLGVAHGTLSFGSIAGLSFTTGDGTADTTMTFTGTVSAINTALAGLVYSPAANYNGADTLTITTSDQGNTGAGGPLSDTDTIAITVVPVNDVPTAPGTRALTIAEDTSTGPVAIGASDVEGDLLTYSLQSGAGPIKGSVAFNQAAGTFTYTPIANANGSDTFTVLVSDGHGGIAEQLVGVTITPVNDAPVAVNDTLATLAGTPVSVQTSVLTANDSDVDGDLLVVANVFGASGGSVSQVGSTVTFIPAPGFAGIAGFNYTLSDTTGATATAHVTVEVGAVNHAPVVASSQSLITLENIGRVFTVAATDADGDPLSFVAGVAAHGTIVSGTGGVFTYIPASGYLGTDSFTVTVNDGHGGTATQTVGVNVVELPDATGFRLFTNTGWTGSIGGSGTVNGTNGHERVAVIDDAGTIVFDASFSRGNDVIVLDGAASAWAVVRLSASIALLSDGDTFVEVPVGATGTAILFDDGARTLAFTSGGAMAIGGQVIGTTLATIAAAPSTGALPGGDDAGSQARLFLSPGSDTSAGGHLLVIGTNSAENLHLLDGVIRLDGSFTRGNDTLVFDHAATSYQASRTGVQLNLAGNGLDLTTPAGDGLLLDFTDSDRSLAFTGPDMTIGTQAITGSAQFLIA